MILVHYNFVLTLSKAERRICLFYSLILSGHSRRETEIGFTEFFHYVERLYLCLNKYEYCGQSEGNTAVNPQVCHLFLCSFSLLDTMRYRTSSSAIHQVLGHYHLPYLSAFVCFTKTVHSA